MKDNPEILQKDVSESKLETDPRYGFYPEQRPIDEYIRKGMVALDKPPGPTSHQAVAWLKDILEIERAGHSGTLDPKVTGVLPVGLQKATKILQALLTSNKKYVTLIHFHNPASKDKIKETLNYFEGEIYQKPPLKSAVKRRLRTRTVYDLQILEIEERDALFTVECEAGTYIRKLCYDIGLILGTGAHMKELRRIKSGPFTEEETIILQDLKDANAFYEEDGDESHLCEIIHPIEDGIKHLPKIWVNDNTVDALCHGAELYAPGVVKAHDSIQRDSEVAIMSLKNELIALAKSLHDSQGILNKEKGTIAKTHQVLMEPGTYPKKWN